MSATIIDGKAQAERLRVEIAEAVARLKQAHGLTPGLAVVLVGEDSASAIYVRSKGEQTLAAGMHSETHRLPAETTQEELEALVDRLNAEGCARYVVTDVLKDGTLRGPNLDLLRNICARTTAPVVASGGVSSLADLRAIASLVPLGVEGAIVGTALYEGAFTLTEALAEVGQA